MKKQQLPSFFKSILWSYDFLKIEPDKDKKFIIVNAINYGNLKHWRWLVKIYGIKEVRRVLKNTPMTAIRPRVLKLASLIFDLQGFNHASRSVK
jgi:hypothetical protein